MKSKYLEEMVVDSNDLVKWYQSVTSATLKFKDNQVRTSQLYCSYLYLVHDPGTTIYKIGITEDVKKRLTNLITGSGRPNLYVVDQIELRVRSLESARWCEQLLHKFFNDKRIVGEWFTLGKRDVVQLIHFRDFINKRIKNAIRKETRKAYLEEKSKRKVKASPSPSPKVPYEHPGIQIAKFQRLPLEEKMAIMEKIAAKFEDPQPAYYRKRLDKIFEDFYHKPEHDESKMR